jgi:Na+-transporting methylmalonyl-CoA/oxaloacetate decarboxylase beta subunit
MYTGDPYNIDIKLDSKSSNRAAEKANTYMKTIGQQLLFKKIKKKFETVLTAPMTFTQYPFEVPMREIPKDVGDNYDAVKATKEREKLEKKKAKMDLECPMKFVGKKGFLNRDV